MKFVSAWLWSKLVHYRECSIKSLTEIILNIGIRFPSRCTLFKSNFRSLGRVGREVWSEAKSLNIVVRICYKSKPTWLLESECKNKQLWLRINCEWSKYLSDVSQKSGCGPNPAFANFRCNQFCWRLPDCCELFVIENTIAPESTAVL